MLNQNNLPFRADFDRGYVTGQNIGLASLVLGTPRGSDHAHEHRRLSGCVLVAA